MRASGGGESLCHKAREYYYDLLYCDRDAIPDAVVRHVEQCSLCRQQIEALRTAFSQAEEEVGRSVPSKDLATLDILSRQFGLLGKHVSCSDARPFLPDLLVPSQEIRIPTPVSVHVEHCPQCTEDLALLREQNLTTDQLTKLRSFYSLSHSRGHGLCRSAKSVIAALGAFSFDGADTQALDHVAACPQCRTRVYRQRARMMDGLHAGANRESDLACKDILAADLFDGVLPFGLDATAIGGTNERRDAVFAHARACLHCMEKAQSLHRTIYAIADRPDSNIDTVCRSEANAEDVCEGAQAVTYRYPVRVQVIRREVPSVTHLVSEARHRLAGGARRHSAGLASLAAVVFLAVTLFLTNTQTATGTLAGEIREALEHAANVRIRQYKGTDPIPNYEMLVAPDQTVRVLRDSLGGIARVDVDKRTGGSMTLATALAGLSANADLRPVQGDASDPAVTIPVEYEHLGENHTSTGKKVLERLTVVINPAKRLPVKMVFFRQDEQGMWELRHTTLFEYLSGPEMQNALTELSRAQ